MTVLFTRNAIIASREYYSGEKYDLGAAAEATQIAAANAVAWPLLPGAISLLNTPFAYGAVGDGITDDFNALQACANSGYCQLPANTTFHTSAPIQIPSNCTFLGQGASSKIDTTAMVSATALLGVIQIGTTATPGRYCDVGNFQFTGSHAIGVRCNNMQFSRLHDIWQISNNIYSYAYYFDLCFNNQIDNLNVQSNIGSRWSPSNTLTFTASVGGATGGTLTSTLICQGGTSQKHAMYFSNGDMRLVTVAADNLTCTWSPALTAGTITTASFGACFWIGGAFNANTCNALVSGAGFATFNFYMSNDTGTGSSFASSFNGACAQNGTYGYFFGNGHSSHTFNAPYTEQCLQPYVFGSFANSNISIGITLNSPLVGCPTSAAMPSFANRVAGLNFDYCAGILVNTPLFPNVVDGSGGSNYPRLVFTGGGSPSFQARGWMTINPAGLPKAALLSYQGRGYSSAPTATLTGGATGGSGASVAATMPGALAGVAITGTGGQFSCTSNSLAVGAYLSISGVSGGTGVIAGYADPTEYIITKTNGTTTFTLALADGTPIQTTAGTTTMTYTITSVTRLVLTVGAGGYTSVGTTPYIYTRAYNCTIKNPFYQSVATFGSACLSVFAAKSASAVNGTGINIEGDTVIADTGNPTGNANATMVKTGGTDATHLITYVLASGNTQSLANAQGTLTVLPVTMP